MENVRKRPTVTLSKPRAVDGGDKVAIGAVDPQWLWAERVASREEAERISLGIEAAARLKLLQRAATNFAATLPSVPEWTNFLRNEIIPVYNAIMTEAPMCLECGKRVARKKTARQLCSPECASRFAAHPRKGGGRQSIVNEPGETAKISINDLVGMSAKRAAK
jgi:hypothetical protein